MRLALLLLSATMFAAENDKTQNFVFSGSVEYGESFSKKLPNGLLFDLRNGGCGWSINVHSPTDDSADYVWPENPPIRGKNELFLDDSYDGDWESPLRHIHTIYFARNAKQAKQELDWIDAMDRGDYHEAEGLDLPQSALGELQFSIVSYTKKPVQNKVVANPKDHWCATDLHFRVVVSRW